MPANHSAVAMRSCYDQALRLQETGDFDAAEQLLRQGLAVVPGEFNVLCLLGEVQLDQRRPEDALASFEQALTVVPGHPRPQEGAGKALLANQQPRKALPFLQAAARLAPTRVTTRLALSRALALSGNVQDADAAMQAALKLDPDRAQVARAADAVRERRFADAEKVLKQHLAQRPDDPIALRLLAQVAMENLRKRAALRLLRRCVEVAPDFILAWNDLAGVQMKEEKFEAALKSVERALALDPRLPHSWTMQGNILARAQRHAEALAAFDQALALAPAHAGALAGQGHVLKTVGRQSEAIEVLRRCLKAQPGFGEAWWSLANLKTFRFEPAEVETMERLASHPALADEPRVNILYSLGKQYEHEGDYARAFENYREGASLRRKHEVYDPVQTQVIHDRIIKTHDAAFFAGRAGWGDPDPSPILVVGLPRSGSTLLEQILASHSQVEGTMELPDLGRAVREVTRLGRNNSDRQARQGQDGDQPDNKLRAHEDSRAHALREYPEASLLLSEADALALGQKYLHDTLRYRTPLPRFIDKMPNNFANLGLLKLILPNAKVINARRHPLDSCLGSWKQLFYRGQSFTYDFFELGEYYLEYQRLMDHWHAVLPGQVLDVHYEDVVRDLEGQTRRVLDFLGLPFEEACLRFHETERAINTASSEQVRQPIYTGAVNYWRHYEPQLGELIGQLEPLLLQLPPADRPDCLR